MPAVPKATTIPDPPLQEMITYLIDVLDDKLDARERKKMKLQLDFLETYFEIRRLYRLGKSNGGRISKEEITKLKNLLKKTYLDSRLARFRSRFRLKIHCSFHRKINVKL